MTTSNKLFDFLFFLQLFLYSIIFVFVLSFYLILPIAFCSTEKNKSRMRKSIIIYGKWILKLGAWPYVKVIYKNFDDHSLGTSIFICNHRSASDPYLMSLLNVELVQIANKWPFKIPFYGYFAKKAEYISIHDLSYEELLSECTRLLDIGVSIIAFPEGTRSGDSNIGSFNGTMFRVALENKYPISPVCIIGNEKIPSRDFRVTPGKIVIHRLKPIFWNEYKNMTAFQLKKHVRDVIIKETAKMEKEINAKIRTVF